MPLDPHLHSGLEEPKAMNRHEAEELIAGGPLGVAQWNRARESEKTLPTLNGASLIQAIPDRFANLNLSDLSLEGVTFGSVGSFSHVRLKAQFWTAHDSQAAGDSSTATSRTRS